MSTEIVVQENSKSVTPQFERNPGNMLDLNPKLKIQVATEIANILKDIIETQGLFKKIGQGKHVIVEGWTTLGTLLGVTAREKSVEEQADGSYVASVDLVRADTGCVIGGGSALCSVDEENWAPSRVDKFARRSMAITRATGKAYRLNFSWIMTLAGYHATPFEEMPDKPTEFKNADPEQHSSVDADYVIDVGFFKGKRIPDLTVHQIEGQINYWTIDPKSEKWRGKKSAIFVEKLRSHMKALAAATPHNPHQGDPNIDDVPF